MDDELVRLVVRTQVVDHEAACLCESCRARMFFSMALEIQAQRNIFAKGISAIRRAIEDADDRGRPIDEGVSATVENWIARFTLKAKLNIPNILERKDYIAVELSDAAVVSLRYDLPMELPKPEADSTEKMSDPALRSSGLAVGSVAASLRAAELKRGIPAQRDKIEDHSIVPDSQLDLLRHKLSRMG